jgi:hypothetical protein
MLRRVVVTSPCSAAAALCTSSRLVSHEHKDITIPGAPKPPMIPHEPIMPMDFNPHIEWFEFPKEIFNPKYPYTREESIRVTEEVWESTQDEMAQRYGIKCNYTTKPTYWMAWLMMVLYCWQTLWGCYRAMGTEPTWNVYRSIVESQPNCPTIEDDDIYLDVWMRPESRERYIRYDKFYQWRPLVKREGAKTQWGIPLERLDVSEWVHMISDR